MWRIGRGNDQQSRRDMRHRKTGRVSFSFCDNVFNSLCFQMEIVATIYIASFIVCDWMFSGIGH